MSSLAHDLAAVAVHIECAALESSREPLQRELQTSFVVAVPLGEQGLLELDAFEAVVLADFAL
jgi:hypothetical protein